jgi:hypothetical protein
MIGYCAQLPHQRKHVGIKPHVEERCRLDLLRLAMRGRLVEHRGHAGEELQENWQEVLYIEIVMKCVSFAARRNGEGAET